MFDVTILGAGPTGLTAALALLRAGCRVRILERNTATTGESRAVGVNRRSLRHLEKVGAAAPILAEAETLRRVRLHVNDRVLTTLPIPQPPSGPPAMVALPQSRTEAILAGLLQERGVPVAFGTAAGTVTQEAGRALVRATGPEGPLEIASDYVLGADGSRSITRKALGLSFPGERYEGDWALFDAVLDWPWPDVQAGVWLKDPGDVMLAITLGDGRHRIIGTAERLEERMRAIMPVGDISWRNAFTLSERRVERYGEGRIWLAGDAAHIHSPVGGMGMNLGIDDAFDFAASLVAGDLAGYERRRLAAATRVMETADRGFRLIISRNPLMRGLRNTALRAVGSSGFLQRWLARRVFAANA